MCGLCPASRIGSKDPVPREDVGELMEIRARHQLRLGLAGVGLSGEDRCFTLHTSEEEAAILSFKRRLTKMYPILPNIVELLVLRRIES